MFGVSPLAGWLNDAGLVPLPICTMPTVGTRVPNMSSQVTGLVDPKRNQPEAVSPFGLAEPLSWTWDELRGLPSETVTKDIHCVTKWSKLDTVWEGVAVDILMERAGSDHAYLLAFCDGGYTTNLPVEDVLDGKAWVAYGYDGEPLDPEHGGPARLLVPHLYFWKSAKWVRSLDLMTEDTWGFWERLGYHSYGDPWKDQRYWGD